MNTSVELFCPPRACSLEPLGGVIGPLPEDFQVEEIPAYPLSGEGEHVFLWVEKRSLTTPELAKRVAREAGVRERDVGYAGMKDKNAVTRQWLSVVSKDPDASAWSLGEGATILEATRHNNKLRTGHLIGNHFRITLVSSAPFDVGRAERIRTFLEEKGLPNYFGPQRFGHQGRNLENALSWLSESVKVEADASAPAVTSEPRRRRDRRKRGGAFENKLLPSVVQSEIFNRYVAARLARDEPLLSGEVVRLRGTGSHFIVENVEQELPRLRSGDLLLTGPMIGPKGLQAMREAKELEESILVQLGIDEKTLGILGRHAPGARRDLAIFPENLTVNLASSERLVVSFSLPSGAYATQLLREFTGSPFLEPRGEQLLT